jgi:hypothetical protein
LVRGWRGGARPKLPILSAAILKPASPRKQFLPAVNNQHRLSAREDSPSRPRANSFKRKIDSDFSYADVAGKQQQCHELSEQRKIKLEEIAVDISKVSSLCDKVGETAGKYQTERPLLEIIHAINDALRGIVRVQENLVKDSLASYNNISFPLAQSSNRYQEITMVDLTQAAKKPRQNQQPEQVQEKKTKEQISFRDAVKSAENSTLVFNLDMGKVPIMNQDTMSQKATLALVTMAAGKEVGNFTS